MSVLEWLMPPRVEPGERGFWSSVREALRGSHQDYTTGNLNRAILLLAIPMVLEMVLESLFAVTDVFWVGRLGANAVATVGITESMLALVFAIGLGVAMSTTAMVARRIGEKEPEGAAIDHLDQQQRCQQTGGDRRSQRHDSHEAGLDLDQHRGTPGGEAQ